MNLRFPPLVAGLVAITMLGCGRAKALKPDAPSASDSTTQTPVHSHTTPPAAVGEASLPESRRTLPGSTAASLSHIVLAPRSLQLALDVAWDLDDRDALVMELWTGIGKRCADTGDVTSAKELIALLELKPESPPVLNSIAEIATELVIALSREGRTDEAIEVSEQIPFSYSRQACNAFSAIAIAREAQSPQDELDPYLRKAIETVDRAGSPRERLESLLVIIRNLAEADRIAQAEILADLAETKQSSRRGWGPVAERHAINGDVEAATQLLQTKLAGLDLDLSHFVDRVLAEGRFASRLELCQAALNQMNNPSLLARGHCRLCEELADSGQREAARAQLGRTLENADKARLSPSDTAQVLLSALTPMITLEGKGMGRNMCHSLQVRCDPEFAAEGFRLLAMRTQADGANEIVQNLATAEALARKVGSLPKRLPILRRIYQIRSAFLDEEHAMQEAAQLESPLERGYAFLGCAEGLPGNAQ